MAAMSTAPAIAVMAAPSSCTARMTLMPSSRSATLAPCPSNPGRTMRSTALAMSALAVALSLAACQSIPSSSIVADAAAATQPAPAANDTVAADDNLNAVLWMQHSAEYRAVSETIYRAAGDKLDDALDTSPQDALVPEERENASILREKPPAVIMDVDETVLDNSPYQARLVREGHEYNSGTWDAWVLEKQAQALPGVVDFAKAATARGVTIVYLSNRGEHLQAATLANLRAVGMPVQDDSVFLGLGTVVEGCKQEGSDKSCRRILANRHYRVLMQFGDQLGDFVKIQANTPEARDKLHDEYAHWFGERWWMLPNPSYGSWESAVFDKAGKQSRTERRRAKREALDTGN